MKRILALVGGALLVTGAWAAVGTVVICPPVFPQFWVLCPTVFLFSFSNSFIQYILDVSVYSTM